MKYKIDTFQIRTHKETVKYANSIISSHTQNFIGIGQIGNLNIHPKINVAVILNQRIRQHIH